MRLNCEAAVIDRSQPQQKARLLKSVINIGYHKRDEEEPSMFLLHENFLKKSVGRYKIKLNVLKVFTKFLHEGKATISFKIPAHDLQIKCDSIQLMAFMKSLRLGLSDNQNLMKRQTSMSDSSQRNFPRLSETPFSIKNRVDTKMVIQNRSDLDKGIPRTVRELTMSSLGLYRFHSSILRLQSLSSLNLNNNNLSEIPTSFGNLPLIDINFSQNQLANTNFDWLKQPTIQTTLRSINLCDNKLLHFPGTLFRISKLRVIVLSNNYITRIPFAIRKFKDLRELLISENKLESLPDALSRISFDVIDISNNPFKRMNSYSKLDIMNRICIKPTINLKELCVRNVVQYKLRYTPETLPRTLIDLLQECPLCSCGNICFASPIIERWHEVELVAKKIVRSTSSPAYADGLFCSVKCVRRYC